MSLLISSYSSSYTGCVLSRGIISANAISAKHLLGVIVMITLVHLNGVDSAPRFYINQTCRQPRGDVCIEIRKCPHFADMLDSTHIPRPRHVIKAIREHQCGFVGNVPKVCCTVNNNQSYNKKNTNSNNKRPVSSNKINSPAQAPAIKSTNTNNGGGGLIGISSFNVDSFIKPPNVSNHPNIGLLPRADQCGSIANDVRITGGSSASLMEFPWMALMAYMTKEGLDFRCGGTLINNRYVLTAAHCILNLNLVGVRVGEQDINSKFDCDENSVKCAPPVQDFYVEDVIMHPGYIPSTFTNDIALIRLATPANMTLPNVEPICLPLGDAANYNLEGKYATISGWGVTETGFKSSGLLKVTVPIISNRDCRKMYAKYTPINQKQLCAGGFQGRDSCGGDSGGPLKYVSLLENAGPRYIQYGIVSYGPRNCGTDGQPGVYTKVAYYMDWILDNIKE